MVKNSYIFFGFLLILILVSCKEDKGNESIPLNKVRGIYEAQLNYLNEALEDDPEDDELLYKRAKVYVNMYRNAEALTDIKKALEVQSSKGEYYLLLAQVQFLLSNNFESIKASEKAESLGLDDPELMVIQARVYWETGDTSRCTLYMNKLAQIVPFHSVLNLLKAKQIAAKGDTLKAVTYYLASVRNDRSNIDALKDLSFIYINKGKEDSALYYILQAKEIAPHHPDFYYAEGRVFSKKNMPQSAAMSYKYSLREDSSYLPSIYQLANLYYSEGNFSESFKYLNRYTRYNNENRDIYKKLIVILAMQNNEMASIPYYERLIQLDTLDIFLKYKLQKLYTLYSIEHSVKNDTVLPAVVNRMVPPDTVRRVVQRKIKDSSVVQPSPVLKTDTSSK